MNSTSEQEIMMLLDGGGDDGSGAGAGAGAGMEQTQQQPSRNASIFLGNDNVSILYSLLCEEGIISTQAENISEIDDMFRYALDEISQEASRAPNLFELNKKFILMFCEMAKNSQPMFRVDKNMHEKYAAYNQQYENMQQKPVAPNIQITQRITKDENMSDQFQKQYDQEMSMRTNGNGSMPPPSSTAAAPPPMSIGSTPFV